MELAVTASATPIALWLNSFFSGYDYAILDFLNTLAVNVGNILTPITKVISFLGEKGIIFFVLAFFLILFPKTRKMGVCVFGAVCCGALITNIILKDMIARVRPFMDEANAHYMDYKSFWDAVGSPAETGFSFPSGHATAAAAGMFALLFTKGKKMILPTILALGLMMFSRNYLIVHYPSDVLFGFIFGIISALLSWGITTLIFNYLEDNDDFPFCNWLLNFELPFKVPSVNSIKEKASDSFDGIKERASGSFDGIKEKASGISFDGIKEKAAAIPRPNIDLQSAGKKLSGGKVAAKAEAEPVKKKSAKKDTSDWNSRWDDYRRAKHPEEFAEEQKSAEASEVAEEEDVKVFTGSKKAVPMAAEPVEEPKEEAPKVPANTIRIPEVQKPVQPAAPAKPVKAAKPVTDDWDDLTALLNTDTESYMEERSSDRASRSQGGAYKPRHVK